MFSLFSYRKTRLDNPGTGNLAYIQNTGFPMFDAGGAGRRVYNSMQFQMPFIVQTRVVTADGFGGLLQGQIGGQALMEPDNGIS